VKKLEIRGDSGEAITPSVCSLKRPLKLKYEEVRTCYKSLSISSKC
jgi:hypothetical protein